MRAERSKAGDEVVPIRVTSAIGEPAEAFPSGGATVATGYALAVFFAGGGLAAWAWMIYKIVEAGGNLPPSGPNVFSRNSAVGCVVLGLIGVAIGAGAFIYTNRLRARALWVGPRGLCVSDSGGERSIPWESIRRVEEVEVVDKVPLKGPLGMIPMRVSSSYHVHHGDDESVRFDKDSVRELARMARLLRDEADRRGIAWTVTRVS